MSNSHLPAFAFSTPPKIIVEWGGALARLAQETALLGKRPLLVCGKSLRANGTLDELLSRFQDAGLTVALHENVPPEPVLPDLESCREAARRHKADCVVAVGGGSVLDIGKATAGLADSQLPAADYFMGIANVPEVGLPILAVPTTAGTGSEATWVSVLSDKSSDRPRKASIRGGALMPRVALVDASLAVSCPDSVTIASGMDAFVQAVESYTSFGANPLTEVLSWRAIVQTRPAHLLELRNDPQNRTIRERMALGTLFGGMALNTSRLGLVHGLAHPVGVLTGAAHGLICAMLLVPVMRFNLSVCRYEYERIGTALIHADEETFIGHLSEFIPSALKIPARLREIGVLEGDLPYIAHESLKSGSTMANRRKVTEKGALSVLESCW